MKVYIRVNGRLDTVYTTAISAVEATLEVWRRLGRVAIVNMTQLTLNTEGVE